MNSVQYHKWMYELHFGILKFIANLINKIVFLVIQ